jgi:phosphoribosyl-ATP pyrophosphohydrolase
MARDVTAEPAALDQLFAVITSRRKSDPATSYTAKLFAKGRPRMAKKIGEEATEVVIAALTETPQRLAAESADLLYHLLVLWADVGITPDDVWAELKRREGMSGLNEKNQRGNGKDGK